MLSKTFELVPLGNFLLTVSMLVFAMAAIPCWQYYGEQAIFYLSSKNLSRYIYKLVYVICIFIGGITIVDVVWDLSAICNALMCLPNLYAIYLQVKKQMI